MVVAQTKRLFGPSFYPSAVYPRAPKEPNWYQIFFLFSSALQLLSSYFLIVFIRHQAVQMDWQSPRFRQRD